MKTVELAFQMPETTDIANLMIDRIDETTVKPNTPVICLNRGRKPLLDTWDGVHVPIPVGWFKTEYGAALHFQRRLIVPGTRNVEVGGFISWIAIRGTEDGRRIIDSDEVCQPFTDEELQNFGESSEGIDRSGLAPMEKVRVSQARASARGQGAGIRPVIGTDQQASDAAREAADHVFDPAGQSEARAAEAEAAAEGVAPRRTSRGR